MNEGNINTTWLLLYRRTEVTGGEINHTYVHRIFSNETCVFDGYLQLLQRHFSLELCVRETLKMFSGLYVT